MANEKDKASETNPEYSVPLSNPGDEIKESDLDRVSGGAPEKDDGSLVA